ncbi:hypothetical protein BV25DRAFT_1824604 [Artomyces pyxidatus]|uniref:Uncharacterized protein n=1 Tax=Artomyces pyxidatus TaxID=48021 RepID=A0ACB8T594_9AGAM|nr:hypothetical protein BV25DRAFT_1824604 [Artomyces pyxidatus]
MPPYPVNTPGYLKLFGTSFESPLSPPEDPRTPLNFDGDDSVHNPRFQRLLKTLRRANEYQENICSWVKRHSSRPKRDLRARFLSKVSVHKNPVVSIDGAHIQRTYIDYLERYGKEESVRREMALRNIKIEQPKTSAELSPVPYGSPLKVEHARDAVRFSDMRSYEPIGFHDMTPRSRQRYQIFLHENMQDVHTEWEKQMAKREAELSSLVRSPVARPKAPQHLRMQLRDEALAHECGLEEGSWEDTLPRRIRPMPVRAFKQREESYISLSDEPCSPLGPSRKRRGSPTVDQGYGPSKRPRQVAFQSSLPAHGGSPRPRMRPGTPRPQSKAIDGDTP